MERETREPSSEGALQDTTSGLQVEFHTGGLDGAFCMELVRSGRMMVDPKQRVLSGQSCGILIASKPNKASGPCVLPGEALAACSEIPDRAVGQSWPSQDHPHFGFNEG